MFNEDSGIIFKIEVFCLLFHNFHLHCMHHSDKRYLHVQPGETVQITGKGTRMGKDLWMVTALKNKCRDVSWRSRVICS